MDRLGSGYSKGGIPGFLNTSFLFNVSSAAQDGNWIALPPAPVIGRQDVGATVINGAVYFVGGFSYVEPYTYREVLRLAQEPVGGWSWLARLPLLTLHTSSLSLVGSTTAWTPLTSVVCAAAAVRVSASFSPHS